jgi:hypothetical protein
MSAAELYEASPVNPRRRATREEMEERAEFLIDYAAEHGPVTVRGLSYQAVVRRVPGIDKTEGGYDKIQRQVLKLRRAKRLPYTDIADSTRWMRKPKSYDSIEAALRSTAQHYRKALCNETDDIVLLDGEDAERDVDVHLCGKTLKLLAERFRRVASRPVEVAEVPDMVFSPIVFAGGDRLEAKSFAGTPAGHHQRHVVFRRDLVDHAGKGILLAPDFDIGVGIDKNSDAALVNLNGRLRPLPTREPKRKTAADRKWPHPFAIELDAIEANDLRRMVREIIENYLPPEQLKILKTAEESERELIAGLVCKIARAP